MDLVRVESDPVNQAFTELRIYFEKNGYFDTNYRWYAIKFALTTIPIVCCVVMVTQFSQTWIHYLAAIFLAAFWQQCGFFMHDFEHNHFTTNRHTDNRLGTLFATVGLGISGDWWRAEHFIHHSLTCCVDVPTNFCDPQMLEPIWAQNSKLWPFFQNKLQYYCIKIQHITFLPVCLFVGRIGIILDSFSHERRLKPWVAFAVHWMWVSAILYQLPSPHERVVFYAIAAVSQGILHIQLLVSHYSKQFTNLSDVATIKDWYRMQVEANIDIENPWWFDWFHGGLNFHLAHHLYPRMPRHNYRQATEHIKRVCKEQDLHYDSCDWTTAVIRTLANLRVLGTHFKLDPR